MRNNHVCEAAALILSQGRDLVQNVIHVITRNGSPGLNNPASFMFFLEGGAALFWWHPTSQSARSVSTAYPCHARNLAPLGSQDGTRRQDLEQCLRHVHDSNSGRKIAARIKDFPDPLTQLIKGIFPGSGPPFEVLFYNGSPVFLQYSSIFP